MPDQSNCLALWFCIHWVVWDYATMLSALEQTFFMDANADHFRRVKSTVGGCLYNKCNENYGDGMSVYKIWIHRNYEGEAVSSPLYSNASNLRHY